MLRLAGAELRLEDECALGDDGQAGPQPFENLDPAAAALADRDRHGLEAALDLDEDHVASFDLLHGLFGQDDRRA